MGRAQVWGTRPGDHEYLAPESCKDEVAQTHDVWQLACILLEVTPFIMSGAASVRQFRQERVSVYAEGDYELTF